MKRSRKSRHRAANMTAPGEIQQLESRQLLTGTVNVLINQRTHDITLIGDAKSNVIDINVAGSEATITGQDGTSLRVGRSIFPAGTSLTLPLDSIRDLHVSLNGGHDSLLVQVEDGVSLRNLTVLTGPGDDQLFFQSSGDGSVNITGNLHINTDGGHDQVVIDALAPIHVGKDATILTGAGNDEIVMVDSTKFTLDVADPEALADSLLDVPDDTDTAGNQLIHVGRDLRINAGVGNDLVALMGVEVGRDASISSGTGKLDSIGISNLRVGRNASLGGVGTTAARNIWVGRDLSVAGGAGADAMVVDNLTVVRNVNVNLGAGNDSLAVGGEILIGGKAQLNGGGGKDQILSEQPLAGARVVSFEGSNVDPDQILIQVLSDLFDRVLS